MTAPPSVPIRKASDHPRFSGDPDAEIPATKKIDTEAARERITATRAVPKSTDKSPGRPRKTEKPAAPAINYTNGMFRAPVTAAYNQGGQLLSYLVYPLGQQFIAQAEVCGTAWDNVARQSPTARRWLMGMTKTGAWGELAAAHIPIFMTALMIFGPQSFRDRMAGQVADSMEAMAQSDVPFQDPN